MLTVMTAIMYLVVRLSGNPISGYVFLLWAIVVGLQSILYIIRWHYHWTTSRHKH